MNDDLLAQIESIASGSFQPFTVGDLTVPLRPVSITETIRVIRRFPSMRAALYGFIDEVVARGGAGDFDFDPKSLLSIAIDEGPEALAAFVAISAGKFGDARAEASFASLPDEYLIPLAVAVKDRTMPEGIESFFARLVQAAVAMKGKEGPARPAAGKRVRKAS